MPAILLLAAFASAVPPMAERDLAQVAAGVGGPSAPLTMGQPWGVQPGVTAEQLDVWWAEQGAEMIAEAVRPTPGVPAWLDPAALQRGDGLRLAANVSAGQ